MTLEDYLLWVVYLAACYGKQKQRNVLIIQKKSFQRDFQAVQSYVYNKR